MENGGTYTYLISSRKVLKIDAPEIFRKEGNFN